MLQCWYVRSFCKRFYYFFWDTYIQILYLEAGELSFNTLLNLTEQGAYTSLLTRTKQGAQLQLADMQMLVNISFLKDKGSTCSFIFYAMIFQWKSAFVNL